MKCNKIVIISILYINVLLFDTQMYAAHNCGLVKSCNNNKNQVFELLTYCDPVLQTVEELTDVMDDCLEKNLALLGKMKLLFS